MSDPVCCFRCFDRLARKSTVAARLWLDFCDTCAEKVTLFPREKRHMKSIAMSKELKVMEQMGYIVTCETNNRVVLKLVGFEEREDGTISYCLDASHGHD